MASVRAVEGHGVAETRGRPGRNQVAPGPVDAGRPHGPKGVLAVDGVSLEVKEGEVFGLFGPNGAGKSTTLRLVAGITRPDSGKIWVSGVDGVARPNEVRGQMSILLETPLLYEGLTARKYLSTFARIAGLTRSAAEARIEEVARLTDLARMMEKKLLHLSLGQRQRIEVARVLLPERRLLLLDEPFNGIDVEMRRRLKDHFRSLLKDGRGIVFTSHNLVESEGFVDRFAFIVAGRIRGVGTARDLRDKFLLPVFRLEVTDRGKARLLIEELPEVRDVQDDEGALRIVLDRRESAALVVAKLVSGGVGVLEMRSSGTMEDVLFRLTATASPAPATIVEGTRDASRGGEAG